MGSVTQTNVLFKGFSESSKKTLDFSKVDADIQDFRMSPTLRSALVEQILSRSNEEAIEVLQAVNNVRRVPGIGDCCITRHEVARFYGVSEEYICGLVNRLGYSSARKKRDVKKVDRFHLLAANPDIVECDYQSELGYVQYRMKQSHANRVDFVLPDRSSQFLLFSPRIMLAMSLGMAYTEKTRVPGPIKCTLMAIKASNYRISEAKQMEIPGIVPGFSIPVTSDGNLVLSPDLFMSLIRATVKETCAEMQSIVHDDVVAEVSAEIFSEVCEEHPAEVPDAVHEEPSDEIIGKPNPIDTPVVSKHRFGRAKCKRPDNWDEIYADCKAGKISKAKAAKSAGMSVTSFTNYFTGKSVW